MDPRTFKIDKPDERPQGFLSMCLEEILQARIDLEWESAMHTAKDNFVNAHLASVLLLGIQPSEDLLVRLMSHELDVKQYIYLAPSRMAQYSRCLEVGSTTLYLHSQELYPGRMVGRWQRSQEQRRHFLERLGQDSYRLAGNSMYLDEPTTESELEMLVGEKEQLPLRDIWFTVSDEFTRYSALLNRVGAKLGFIERQAPNQHKS